MHKILITGATSGIGEELARQLQTTGKLLLTGRNFDKLTQLKNQLKGDVEIRSCDLSKNTQSLLDWMEEEKPDLIFNNAGFGLYGYFNELTPDELEQMIFVNCTSLASITHGAINVWKKHSMKGCVMNISSCASFVPFPIGSLYGATKSFVTQLSSSLDIEYAPMGIRILAACPGAVNTPFSQRASKGKFTTNENAFSIPCERVVRKILEQVKEKTPVKVIDERYQFLMFIKNFIPSRLIGKWVAYHLKKRL